MIEIYPWQHGQWERCQRRLRAKNLPHALLLSGQSGIGKLHFAQALAQALLCHAPRADGAACGRCQGCRLFAAGVHPDFRGVTPEENSDQIRIDAIRALNEFIALSRQYGRYKLALIHPAQAMNRNAANSLLKTLEEPPPHTLILLVGARPDLLPATIRSRCQQLRFHAPPRAQAGLWLQDQVQDAELLLAMAQGAPLTARKLAANDGLQLRRQVFDELKQLTDGAISAVGLAARWQKLDSEQLSVWLWSWLADIIRLWFDADAERLENPDIQSDLQELARRLGLTQCFVLQDNLYRHRRMLSAGLNELLMREDLLLAWTGAFERG